MLLAMPTASDCLVGLLPERYGATVARLRRIFLFFLGWFLMDIKYGATVAHLRRNFFWVFPRSLVGDGSPGGRTGDMVQLWRVCAVFFDACWISFLIHIMFVTF